MVPLFLGLQAANLVLLVATFAMGWGAFAGAQPTRMYPLHVGMGVCAGLMATLTHVAVYTYFMATSRWLQAAADKGGLDPAEMVAPALKRKSRTFALMMMAVGATMLAMFAGAAADPTVRPWWPGEVHMVVAALALAANVAAAMGEFRLIKAQGTLIDHALAALNRMPGIRVEG